MGEDKAFDYLDRAAQKYCHLPALRRRPHQGRGAWRGRSVDQLCARRPGRKGRKGFPLETITPTDGTGAEIGSMSIVRGARNLEAAKKFYDWALTPGAQALGAATLQFQLPSNRRNQGGPPRAGLPARSR